MYILYLIYIIWFPGPEWGEARGWRGGGWRSDPSTLLLRGHDERHEQGDCAGDVASDFYGGGHGVVEALGKPCSNATSPLWWRDERYEQGDRVRGLLVQILLLLQGNNDIIERWPTLRLTRLPITRKCTMVTISYLQERRREALSKFVGIIKVSILIVLS